MDLNLFLFYFVIFLSIQNYGHYLSCYNIYDAIWELNSTFIIQCICGSHLYHLQEHQKFSQKDMKAIKTYDYSNNHTCESFYIIIVCSALFCLRRVHPTTNSMTNGCGLDSLMRIVHSCWKQCCYDLFAFPELYWHTFAIVSITREFQNQSLIMNFIIFILWC